MFRSTVEVTTSTKRSRAKGIVSRAVPECVDDQVDHHATCPKQAMASVVDKHLWGKPTVEWHDKAKANARRAQLVAPVGQYVARPVLEYVTATTAPPATICERGS